MKARLFSKQTYRTLVLVPGMREIGYAQGVGPLGSSVGVTRWGVRCLPRATPPLARISAARYWLAKVIRSQEFDQVVVVLPDHAHLCQKKNPTKLGRMARSLRLQADLMGYPASAQKRTELKAYRGKPALPAWAPQVPPRARWAFAALTLPRNKGGWARRTA